MAKDSKDKALKEQLKKVHHSTEYCRHCGKKVSSSTRHESGHREWEHESGASSPMKG